MNSGRNRDINVINDIRSEIPQNNSSTPKKTFLSHTSQGKRKNSQTEEAYKIIKRVQIRKKDESGMFADYIAEKLRKMKYETRAILQHQIQDLIFETEMDERLFPLE